MPVASDLQDLVSDVSAAIAERKSLDQADLIVLRRKLTAAAEDARKAESAGLTDRMALAELVGAVEMGVADLAGRARHARSLIPGFRPEAHYG